MMQASRCKRCGSGYVGRCPVCKDKKLEPRTGIRISERKPAEVLKPEPVGTNLASLIPEWAKSMKGGCSCRDWEVKMNRWRADGCEAHREQIIDHLMSQSDHLVKPLQHIPAALKRVVAGKMLDKAIKMSR
jgi:hypothetical protein